MDRPRFHDSGETLELLDRAREGDAAALGELFERHRERLLLMVNLRMAEVLRGRLDASDVLQETFFDVARRLPEFLKKPDVPFFVWLRSLTAQKLVDLHRHHVGTKARDPRREVALPVEYVPEATTAALAARLVGQVTSPSRKLMRLEEQLRLQEALNDMAPREREIIALRHFEQLSNSETARELSISEAAASKRYMRALARFKGILANLGMESVFSG